MKIFQKGELSFSLIIPFLYLISLAFRSLSFGFFHTPNSNYPYFSTFLSALYEMSIGIFELISAFKTTSTYILNIMYR